MRYGQSAVSCTISHSAWLTHNQLCSITWVHKCEYWLQRSTGHKNQKQSEQQVAGGETPQQLNRSRLESDFETCTWFHLMVRSTGQEGSRHVYAPHKQTHTHGHTRAWTGEAGNSFGWQKSWKNNGTWGSYTQTGQIKHVIIRGPADLRLAASKWMLGQGRAF